MDQTVGSMYSTAYTEVQKDTCCHATAVNDELRNKSLTNLKDALSEHEGMESKTTVFDTRVS